MEESEQQHYRAVDTTGALLDKFKPGIYLDTNVLMEYWLAEGMDRDIEDDIEELVRPNKYLDFLKELLQADRRTSLMTEIRKMALCSRASLIFTPFSLLEFLKIHVESIFKWYVVEATSIDFLEFKINKRNIVDYLDKILDMGNQARGERDSKPPDERGDTSGPEFVCGDLWIEPSFVLSNGFQGLSEADVVNFDLTHPKVWQEFRLFPYYQTSLADMIHILLASHLGCEYIASFDSHFKILKEGGVKEIIRGTTGIQVLNSPEMIREILTQYPLES